MKHFILERLTAGARCQQSRPTTWAAAEAHGQWPSQQLAGGQREPRVLYVLGFLRTLVPVPAPHSPRRKHTIRNPNSRDKSLEQREADSVGRQLTVYGARGKAGCSWQAFAWGVCLHAHGLAAVGAQERLLSSERM